MLKLARDKNSYRALFIAVGFPDGTAEKTTPMQETKRLGFDPWVGKILRRRNWQPAPVFLPQKFHGQRSLAGYSPQGLKESDMTEELNTHTHSSNYLTLIIGIKTHTHTHTHKCKLSSSVLCHEAHSLSLHCQHSLELPYPYNAQFLQFCIYISDFDTKYLLKLNNKFLINLLPSSFYFFLHVFVHFLFNLTFSMT